MTRLKKLNKLGNALRAQRGVLFNNGKPWKRDTAPRKDAATQARVDRWKFRLSTKGQ